GLVDAVLAGRVTDLLDGVADDVLDAADVDTGLLLVPDAGVDSDEGVCCDVFVWLVDCVCGSCRQGDVGSPFGDAAPQALSCLSECERQRHTCYRQDGCGDQKLRNGKTATSAVTTRAVPGCPGTLLYVMSAQSSKHRLVSSVRRLFLFRRRRASAHRRLTPVTVPAFAGSATRNHPVRTPFLWGRLSSVSSRKEGAALVTTVLFAILGAVMVIVAISAYVVSSRLAAAERDRAEALEAVESVLSTYEAHLAKDPLYFLHHVSPYEEARVCVLGPVDQVVQPGSEWPGNCGTRWEYTKPTGEDQREHRTVRLKVEAPSPHRPYLTLQAVAAVGSSRVARERTFTVRSVATSLIYADQDLFIDAVARELSVPLEVSGDIYTGGRLFLPSVENVDFSDTLLMAEGGFTPQVAIRPSQFVRFFARNPDGSGLV